MLCHFFLGELAVDAYPSKWTSSLICVYSSTNIDRLNQWILICCRPSDYLAFVCHSINRSRSFFPLSYSRIRKKIREKKLSIRMKWVIRVYSVEKNEENSHHHHFYHLSWTKFRIGIGYLQWVIQFGSSLFTNRV